MLAIHNIDIQSDTFHLRNVTLSIEMHTCLSLMGPSGSGKTTILEAVCGLRKVLKGNITLDGKDITTLPPAERNIALVPQDNALFDHLTVRENIGFGLTLQKVSNNDIRQRVENLCEKLAITQLIDRKPRNLSGGEAKRVALARALAIKPDLLCLDEALTGLDEEMKSETLKLIKSMIQQENITTLHITHSTNEAVELSNKILHIDEVVS